MSGATVASSVGGALASSAVNSIIGGSGGGSSGGSGSSASPQLQQYVLYGPHQSTNPMSNQYGSKVNDGGSIRPSQAGKARAATKQELSTTPTQGTDEESSMAHQEFQGAWADRLSRFLDYNTRNLG